jgi:hypothetical protein
VPVIGKRKKPKEGGEGIGDIEPKPA